MASVRKKIFVLVLSSLPGFSREDLKSHLSELQIISDLELIELSGQPAAEFGPERWLELAKRIHQMQDQAIGFVVVCGLDNILFASAAISFMINPVLCPIVFTGSSGFFSDDKKMEVRGNLINSVQIAKSGIKEVCIMFGNRLLRANQSSFSQEVSLNVFNAPEKATLGRIDFSVRLNELYQSFKGPKIKTVLDLFNNISFLSLPLRPNLEIDRLDFEALVINAGRQQQLPERVFEKLEEIAKTKPIMIYSKKVGDDLVIPDNVILARNLTFESAVSKFMWILSQGRQSAKVKEMMAKNLAGEFFE